ncbi:DinB family protein [Daejeonia sp. YH14]|uniref:DinB family protein n=1 Tax=Daejeonia sp. YH14 TaxID=3439042 RepID=UPI003F49840B
MTEFEKYIQTYISLIPTDNWIQEMKNATNETLKIYADLTEEQGNFAYAEGKWTLKMLLEHLTDTEKIFSYRALCSARGDQTPLPGFDEVEYAKHGIASQLTNEVLMEEFQLSRLASLVFYAKLPQDRFLLSGNVNGNRISVETIGKLTVGHHLHHLNIIRKRYLPNF